ncbi:MAG: hypothetical protein WB709_10700 [Solirubrobacteraceae bacterium]
MAKVKDFLGNTKNAILAVGALATTVVAVAGAIHLFQPGSPPTGIRADIEDVTLEANVGLQEFEDREQTADVGIPGSPVSAPAGYRFAAYTAVAGSGESTTSTSGAGTAPSTSTPETTPETTPEHTTPTSTTPHTGTHKRRSEKVTKKHIQESEGGSSGTQTSTHVYKRTKVTGSTASEGAAAEGSSGPSGVPFVKPPPPETSFKSEGSAKTLNGTGASTSEVEGVLAEAATTPATEASPSKEGAAPEATIALPQHCGSSCAAGTTVEQILADNPSPAQAAKKVAAVFRHSRARYYDHELHPLGADVEYTLKLTGFVHNDAVLEWTLWSQSENHPLPHSWWQKVIVKQVKPSRYEETVSGTFWAPLPPRPGNYTFHLAVYDEQGNRRGHGSTPLFH